MCSEYDGKSTLWELNVRSKYSRYDVDDRSLEICDSCNRVMRKSESIVLADNCCEEFLIGGLELVW